MTMHANRRRPSNREPTRALGARGFLVAFVMGLIAIGTSFPIAPASATTTPGTVLWAARWDGAGGNDVPAAHAVSPDGGTIVLTGRTTNTKGSRDIATATFNAADGTHLWSATFDGRARGNDSATDVVFTSAGTVVVTGRSDGATTNADFITIAYDGATGAMLWHARLDGGSAKNDAAAAIASRPDGAVVVTGTVGGAGGRQDFETLAYNSTTGATIWSRRWAGEHPRKDSYNSAATLAISATGTELLVTGVTLVPDIESSWLPAVIAYDTATGTKQWASLPMSGFCIAAIPRAIALSADGLHAYVVGYYDGGCNESIPGSSPSPSVRAMAQSCGRRRRASTTPTARARPR